MLVLSRKEGESLCIGDDIRITITRVNGNKVRIGIESAANLPILRSELVEKRQDRINSESDLLSIQSIDEHSVCSLISADTFC